MSDYESKVKISVDDTALTGAEKRIKELANSKINIDIAVDAKNQTKKITNSIEQGLKNISFDLDVGVNADKIISDIRSALNAASDSVDDIINIQLKVDNEELANQIRSAVNKVGFGDEPITVDVQINRQSLQEDINAALDGLDLPVHLNVNAEELEADIRQAINNFTDIQIDLHVNTDNLRQEIDNTINTGNPIVYDFDTGQAGELEQLLNGINTCGIRGQSVFQSFGDTLQEAFSTFTLANLLQDAIYEVVDVGEEAIDTVKELNDQTTSLRMATGESYTYVKDLMSDYNELGQELGALTSEVASGADQWLRQGKSIGDTNTLLRDSMILSKISNLDSAESTELLTSSMNGYKVAVEDVIDIVDKVGSIDMASATDASGLMEAMSRTATIANMADVSMDKLLSYLAVTGETGNRTMSSIGESFKTIFTRMSDIKADKLELVDEDGTAELLSDVELTLQKVGIDLRKTVTEYNSYSDVLDNLASKWDTLNEAQQNALSKAFAGTRQAEIFRSLMENYNKVYKYEDIASNSSGTAEMKFSEIYLESLESKTNSLKASLEGLTSSLISDDLYADVLDTAKAMTDLTTQTGILKGLLAGIGSAGGLFVFQSLTGWIRGAVQEFSNLSAAMDILQAGNITDDIFANLMNLTDGLSQSQTRLVLSSTSLSDAQRVAILMGQGMSQAEAEATISTLGLATAQGTATGATVTFSGALRGLWSTLMANPLVLVAAGVTAVTMAYNAYQNHVQEMIEQANEATTAWESTKSSLQDYTSQYEELKTKLESGKLSEAEMLSVKQQILDIQNQITEQYGAQGTGIDLVNGKLETQLGILQNISQEEAIRNLAINGDSYEKAKTEMKTPRSYDLGRVSNTVLNDANSELGKAFQEIIAKYENIKIEGIEGSLYSHIGFYGDANEADEQISSFMADMERLTQSYSDSIGENIVTSIAEESLAKNSEIIETYQDNYKSFLEQSLYAQGDGDILNDYATAVDNYNTALLSGDTSKIEEAKTAFDEASAAKDEFLSADGNAQYIDMFDEVTDQLDQATIKYLDFQDAIAGTASDGNVFKAQETQIKKLAEYLQFLELNADNVKDALLTDGFQKGEMTFNSLAELYGVDTSDNTAVQAFIDLLVELGIIAEGTSENVEGVSTSIAELTSETQDVISQISAVQSALNEQSTGKSISLDTFNSDELKDYQSALEYVNGTLQLNEEKVTAITQAKADEAIATNEANKAQKQSEYLQNAAEIERLRKELKSLDEGTTEYTNTKSELDSLLSSNSAIAMECQQYDLLSASIREATSAYQNWLDKQNTSESGDMFDSSMDAMIAIDDVADSDSDDYGRVGTKKYKAAVEFIIPDTIDKDDAVAVQNYMDSIGKYFDYDENGERVGMDITQFCTDAVRAGLMNVEVDAEGNEFFNLADGVKMEDFADKLNFTNAMVQAFFGEMEEFGGEFSWADEAIQTVGDLGVKAYESAEALRGIEGYSDMEITMDVSDIENVDEKVSALDSTVQQMNDLKAKVAVDSSEAQYANDIIQYCVAQKQELNEPVFMNIDVSQVDGDLSGIISLVQQLQTAKNDLDIQAAVGADTTEAQGKVDSLVQQIQEKSPEIKATIGDIDTSNVDTILAGVSAKTAEMWVTLGVDETAITGYTPENKTATVTYELDSTEVDLYNPSNLRRTVTYTITTEGEAPKVNGTAHVNGTAFANGSLHVPKDATTRQRIGRALASGDWGVDKAETALVGELGKELVVYGNRYWTVGDTGAEFAHIPKGAIVFNHKQTEEIFRNGYVTSGGGRGKAYAHGTAYVTGGISTKNANKTAAVSGSSTSSSSNNASTKATNANTDATEDNTDAQKESIDWIERLVDATEREADALEKAIESFEMHENQNKAIDAYVKKSQEYMKDLRNAQNAYASKANAVNLSDAYKKKVRNGTLVIEDITDEDLKEKIENYQKWYDKAKELGEQIEEINQSIRETQIEKLENIADDYENIVSYVESLADYYQTISDLSEDLNLVGDETALLSVLKQQVVIRQALVNEQQELTDQLNALMKAGYIAEGTDTWHEWKTEINNVQQSILECDSALNELRQTIREVRLEDFYNSLDELDFTADMASSIRGLMSEAGIYDDSVKLTSSGIAQLGLMGTELVSAKQKVANYNTAIEALNKDLENGDITQAQFNEQLREYQKDQMDAISATKDAKDAILDLIKNGIEKQTEAMDELIAKRKDAMSQQREYYDFEKEMSDKSSEIRKIQAQIQALSGDDSISATQRRRSLQSQLKELQEEYAQSQKDREYDLIQDAYDETLESFKENQDATILELETSLDAQNNAIANALAVAKDNYTTVYEELGTLASEYNFTLTDAITTPWTDAISAIEQYQDAVGKLSGNIDIDTTPITTTDPTKAETTPTTNEASKQNVSKSANGTWIKQSGKWWYEHDDGSYTTNGFETIDGKQYYFDSSGWMKTGWVKSGTDSTGAAAWYYMNSDGSMAKNKWIGNYYVGSDGVMLRNTTTPDGYQVDKNGLWIGAKSSSSSSSSKAKVSATTKTLQYGMTDSQVGTLQQALKSLGYYNGNIDNIFGSQTLSALKQFQTDAKKRGDYTGQIDGVCGALTRSAFKVKGYASGTLNATKGLHWLDEEGPELIVAEDGSLITPYGRLKEMTGGEIVMNADQTKRFVEMINGGYNYPQLEKPQLPEVTKVNRDTINNNISYDALVKVNGDITREVYPGIEKVCREAFDYTKKELNKYSKR